MLLRVECYNRVYYHTNKKIKNQKYHWYFRSSQIKTCSRRVVSIVL